MEEAIKQYRSVLSQTPLDEFEVDERPGVRITPKDTWIEVRLRYLTDPRRVGKVKTELTARIIGGVQ